MRFVPILMQDTFPPLKHVTISLNSLCTWNGLLSIIYPFIYQVNNLWSFVLMLKLIKWSKILRVVNCLDSSRQTKILILLLLEHMISSIRSFQRTLSGMQAVLCGQFINNTRPLNTYTVCYLSQSRRNLLLVSFA